MAHFIHQEELENQAWWALMAKAHKKIMREMIDPPKWIPFIDYPERGKDE